MPEPSNRRFLSTTKLVVGALAMTVLMLGVMLTAQGFINTRDYRNGILEAIKAETGRDATIKGNVSLWLLPLPTLYVPNVELQGASADDPSVSVDMMKLRLPVGALLGSRLRVSAITLQNPRLTLVRSSDHVIHWGWLNPDLIKTLQNSGGGTTVTIALRDGTISYHNDKSDRDINAENVNADIIAGRALSINSDMAVGGHVLRADIQTHSAAISAPIPFTAHFYEDGKHIVQWDGTLNLSGKTPGIRAKMVFSVDDALAFLNRAPEGPPQAMPLAISGDWSQEGADITLANMKVKGLGSEGAGKATMAWHGWKPVFTAETHFSVLDYGQWKTLLMAAFMPASATPIFSDSGQSENASLLPVNMEASVHFTADTLAAGTQAWKNAALSADLADAALTINQFSIALPGDSTFNLFGIISQGVNGLHFDGNMTSDGKSLKTLLTDFDASASGLPDTGFGEFHVNSNLFISSDQLRLSEADVKLGGLHLNGGMVDYFDARRPRIEADIKLKDINFDYFRDVWRARQQQKTGTEASDVFSIDRSKSFSWLKRLQTTIDFKVSVDNFTFLDHKGNSASFRLFAKQGEAGIYDIRLNYPDSVADASFTLNVNGDQPAVNVILNTNQFNTDYFSATPPGATQKVPAPILPPAPGSKKIWPTSLIDFGWMQGFNGTFDLSIDQLTHDAITLNNFKVQAKLENNLLTLQNCSFLHWQGRWGVNGSIYGGAVPGVALSFSLFNGELHDILHALTGRDNVSGRLSVSGTLSTSGVNALSWVSQADSKIVMAARGVTAEGINLQGVVHAVSVSRTAADVFNNVNRSLVNGSTMFDIDGNINVKGGIMGTPGMTLKSGNIIGNMTGSVQLVPWTMDLTTLFQFPAMTSDTIPTMTVRVAGPIATPTLKTDTSSLEAYVTKRITGN